MRPIAAGDRRSTNRHWRRPAPEDVARAIVYLASDTADFITGVALAVDNGLILV